ncbi:MAG: adenylate kinase [Actinomycetota bacterium]|nr:adenylate kinase [Actinomycetota bacterium]
MRLVLLGPPGAGKGTQAVHIARAFEVPRIATGDLFREHAAQDTDLGREAKEYMDRGELVPDDLVLRMVSDRLRRDDARQGFLFDGFPRTVAQAIALEDHLAGAGTPLDVVVRFNVPESEIVHRIVNRRTCPTDGSVYHLDFAPPQTDEVCDLCGTPLVHRADDTEPVVRRRLEEYHAKTERLEYFYWERGLLRDVESVGPVDDVTRRTLAVLDDIADGDAA